jgi:hypothetical protein
MILNAYGRVLTAVPSFVASCEGQIFDDDEGCKVVCCDDVNMQYLPFQFLLNSVQELCSYHAPSFSVAAWRPTRRDFRPATF